MNPADAPVVPESWWRRRIVAPIVAPPNLAKMSSTIRERAIQYWRNVDAWLGAAKQGRPEALYNLGLLYSTGQGVALDYIEAHKWFNLAALRGNREALQHRVELAREMSADQIAEAQRAAREGRHGSLEAALHWSWRLLDAQARTLLHVSNLFANPVATEAAVMVNAQLEAATGAQGQVFFCNSGAEANEAALKLKDREQWMGWNRALAAERLKLVVQNRRYLLLHERGEEPNLASAALAAWLTANPWRERYSARGSRRAASSSTRSWTRRSPARSGAPSGPACSAGGRWRCTRGCSRRSPW